MPLAHRTHTLPKIWNEPDTLSRRDGIQQWNQARETDLHPTPVPALALEADIVRVDSLQTKRDFSFWQRYTEWRRFRFTLPFHSSEVVSCSEYSEIARIGSVKGKEVDMGVPVRIQVRPW